MEFPGQAADTHCEAEFANGENDLTFMVNKAIMYIDTQVM